MKMKKNNGFTFIELLVVVGFSLLFTAFLPSLFSSSAIPLKELASNIQAVSSIASFNSIVTVTNSEASRKTPGTIDSNDAVNDIWWYLPAKNKWVNVNFANMTVNGMQVANPSQAMTDVVPGTNNKKYFVAFKGKTDSIIASSEGDNSAKTYTDITDINYYIRYKNITIPFDFSFITDPCYIVPMPIKVSDDPDGTGKDVTFNVPLTVGKNASSNVIYKDDFTIEFKSVDPSSFDYSTISSYWGVPGKKGFDISPSLASGVETIKIYDTFNNSDLLPGIKAYYKAPPGSTSGYSTTSYTYIGESGSGTNNLGVITIPGAEQGGEVYLDGSAIGYGEYYYVIPSS
jgi:type II secretory pathway pseudopilin PulG